MFRNIFDYGFWTGLYWFTLVSAEIKRVGVRLYNRVCECIWLYPHVVFSARWRATCQVQNLPHHTTAPPHRTKTKKTAPTQTEKWKFNYKTIVTDLNILPCPLHT